MNTQKGRSMVEMLGVLAIIGVLSVGAIAGYSKAMMKYKLNKHAEAANMLINNVLQLKGQLKFTSGTITHYEELLKKMNLLPDGIEFSGNNSLYDIWFKSKIRVSYNNEQNNNFGGISFFFPQAAYGAEICRNIVIAGKENSSDLWQIETQKCDGDNCQKYYGNAYGDAYCEKGYKCLRNLTLDDMSSLCNICDDQECVLHILWYK